jgi:hypothetical protein
MEWMTRKIFAAQSAFLPDKMLQNLGKKVVLLDSFLAGATAEVP